MLPHQETPRGLRARASAIEANAERAEAYAVAVEAWPCREDEAARARAYAATLRRSAEDYRAKAAKAEAAALRQPWPAPGYRLPDEARAELQRLCAERADELEAEEA